jgi:hypothetical protein
MEELKIHQWIHHELERSDQKALLEALLSAYGEHIRSLKEEESLRLMVSTQNYIKRSQWLKNPDLNVEVGDLCFIDYGNAYRLEAGYQHFGLVMAKSYGKLFVVPMSSNEQNVSSAYDQKLNPYGKKHLFRFDKSCGLKKDSVLFLNDAKFISASRVIERLGHLEVESVRFRQILLRIQQILFSTQ